MEIYDKRDFDFEIVNILLRNQKTNGLGTWYVALGMWVLPSLHK